MSASANSELRESLQGLAADLHLLARLHDRELDPETLDLLRTIRFPDELGLRCEDKRAADGNALLHGALAELKDPEPQMLDELAADFADIYLNHGLRASPCESVWLDEEGLAMQEPMFQVRSWYRRYGLGSDNWRLRSDDHLVLQLEFVATLLETAGSDDDPSAVLGDAARFLDEHLLRWLDEFSARVAHRCATPVYAGLSLVTASYLDALRELLAFLLDAPRPTPEEIAERMKPEAVPVEPPSSYVPGSSPTW